MKTTKLALAVMLATGLAAAPFAAQAKSHKKHHASMSQTTTGANMKKTVPPDASGQGGAGPGSDQGGSMTKPQNGMSK
ncbi:hypothetical protein KUL72_27460 [Bradyrhizobium arachidis]|uniref:hypothetical protein n=1 Tax=Bradyrhizobium TaxID=374 RepID=UPI00188B8868|nr:MULTISPECIES: hypothetical protein [Bradyrhizobium]MDN4988535.1 hypothetical protein [Bradyrhizobium sp. WYCCWR 13022]QOZ54526.1 hypothetical protein XH90_26495 [Bradyrhizobium sp. CCBAU 53338]UVO35165.1 hypothetical protein KUL72_27460 [Bradyrhizobium arachidis]